MLAGVTELFDVEGQDGDHDIDGEPGSNIGESYEVEGGLFEPEVPLEVGVVGYERLGIALIAEVDELLAVLFALFDKHDLPDAGEEEDRGEAADQHDNDSHREKV